MRQDDVDDFLLSTTICPRRLFVIDECFDTRRPKNLKNTKFTYLVFGIGERQN